jgi:hypothetical protein
MFGHINCKVADEGGALVARIALMLSLVSLAGAAQADTENVRKGHSQLQFRPAHASGGSTAANRPTYSEKHGMFRHLDFDGDGFVSKAEAAGFATATLGFDRADRNRDGKLSFAEYDLIGAPTRKVAKGKGPASVGATKKKSD